MSGLAAYATPDFLVVADHTDLSVVITKGVDVVYSMDYGDGAGRTAGNATGMFNHTFYTPGVYSTSVYAIDQQKSVQVSIEMGPLCYTYMWQRAT